MLGAGSSPPGLIAYTFAAFASASIALEFARGTRGRKALAGGSWVRAFSGLVATNRRRYGGYVIHAAIIMLAVGIAGSSSYQTVRDARLRPGQGLNIAGYDITYRRSVVREGANAIQQRALVDVRDGKRSLGVLEPGKNKYPVEAFFSTEVAIRSNWLTGEDLFVVAQQFNSNGSVDFRVFVKPLVNLIWIAGLLFVAGSLVALWPDAREQRRLAARYEGVVAVKG